MNAAAAGDALPHLSGEGAPVRQVIAAHYLKGCRHIVEIGGAGLPISRFITHDAESVIVFDPKIAPVENSIARGETRVRHVAAKFQSQRLPSDLPSLGVVLLGLSLKPLGSRAALDESLMALLRRADVAVIDYSPALPRALEQAPALIAACGLWAAVTIDLSISDGVLEKSGHGQRRLHVLKRAANAQ